MKQSELIEQFCALIREDRERNGYTDKEIVERILDCDGCDSFKKFIDVFNT